jgi:hypothetical protein
MLPNIGSRFGSFFGSLLAFPLQPRLERVTITPNHVQMAMVEFESTPSKLRLSPAGLQQVDARLEQLDWRKQSPDWAEAANVAVITLKRFRGRKRHHLPIAFNLFAKPWISIGDRWQSRAIPSGNKIPNRCPIP